VRVDLHPEARKEARSAALWYEARRAGWGDRFLERLDEVLTRLGESPSLYAIWPGTADAPVPIRKAALEQFPYLLAFEIHAEHVLVLAVAHAKRRPLYWLARNSPGPR
jgi:hypothetical protein